MKDRRISSLVMMISFSFFVVSCSASPLTPTLTKEAIASANTAVSNLASPTLTVPVVMETPSIIASLTPTLINTSTPTSVPTIQATSTIKPLPIPTPPGIDPIEQVLWLYETNNGCQLPCWWGITPGQTTWETAEQFFNSFVPDILSVSGSKGTSYSPRIPLSMEVFGTNYTLPTYTVRDGIIIGIETDVSIVRGSPSDYFSPYILSTFLTTYGQPTEVWLFTYAYTYENVLPFSVVLFYSDQGIAAIYSDNADEVGDLVRGCPQENPLSVLRLWSPDRHLTFEQVKSSSTVLHRDYLSLELSTGMDEATFYQIFQNPGNTTCLETPANLWR